MDAILIRDLHLTIMNESEFYETVLVGMLKCIEPRFKKGDYDPEKFTNALQDRIRDYIKHNRGSAYHGTVVDKKHRTEVASNIVKEFTEEMELGNFHTME